MDGIVVSAAPVGIDFARHILAGVLFGQYRHVKLPDCPHVETLVLLKDLLEVWKLKWKYMLARDISARLHDFAAGAWRILEGRGKGLFFALGAQQFGLEFDAVAIRKSQRFFQKNRSILVLYRVGSSRAHLFVQHVHHLGRIGDRAVHRGKHVIEKRNHGLSLDHGLAGFAVFIFRYVGGSEVFLDVEVFGATLEPLVEAEGLVLEGVRQFMRQHGTLQIGRHPVQQIYSFGFGIVIAGYLLFEQADEKCLQIEIFRQQAEFLQHQLSAFQALDVFVLGHVFLQVGNNFLTAGQTALDPMLDGKRSVFAGKVEDGVHVAEELLSLLGGDFGLRFGFGVSLLGWNRRLGLLDSSWRGLGRWRCRLLGYRQAGQ